MTVGSRLGSVDIGALTNTLLFSNTGRLWYDVTVSIANRNKEDVEIRLALVQGSSASDLTDAEWLEYDTTIRTKGVLERSGIRVATGYCLIGYSNKNNVSFNVWG